MALRFERREFCHRNGRVTLPLLNAVDCLLTFAFAVLPLYGLKHRRCNDAALVTAIERCIKRSLDLIGNVELDS